MQFNLASLSMRCDIAMLGMLHRAALGEGPPQMRRLVTRGPGGFQLLDPYTGIGRPPLIRRSAWALLPVYNRLGSGVQSIKTVAEFQKYLQDRINRLIDRGLADDNLSRENSPRR